MAGRPPGPHAQHQHRGAEATAAKDYNVLSSVHSVTARPQHGPIPIGRCTPCEAWLQYAHNLPREYGLSGVQGGVVGRKAGCCTYRYTVDVSGHEVFRCDEPTDFRTRACNPRTAKHSGNVFLAVCGPKLAWQVRTPSGKRLGRLLDNPHPQDHQAKDTNFLVVPDGDARAAYTVRPETPGRGIELRVNGPIRLAIFDANGDSVVGSFHLKHEGVLEVVFPRTAPADHRALLLAGLFFWDRHRWRKEFGEADLLDHVGRSPFMALGGGIRVGGVGGGGGAAMAAATI